MAIRRTIQMPDHPPIKAGDRYLWRNPCGGGDSTLTVAGLVWDSDGDAPEWLVTWEDQGFFYPGSNSYFAVCDMIRDGLLVRID